jgi:hypothetical protein
LPKEYFSRWSKSGLTAEADCHILPPRLTEGMKFVDIFRSRLSGKPLIVGSSKEIEFV